MAFSLKKEDTDDSVIYYLNFILNKQSIKVEIEVQNNTPKLAYPYYGSLKVLHQDPDTNNIKLIGFIVRGLFDKEIRDILANKGFSFEFVGSIFLLKNESGFLMQDIEGIAKIIESQLSAKGILSLCKD
jgi:hypothetical protein